MLSLEVYSHVAQWSPSTHRQVKNCIINNPVSPEVSWRTALISLFCLDYCMTHGDTSSTSEYSKHWVSDATAETLCCSTGVLRTRGGPATGTTD